MKASTTRALVLAITAAFLWTTTNVSTADTFRPVLRGRRGVVAGGHPLSVEAGMRVLQHGGNAVDAGVATILAASVIEFSHFSFGGEVPILIKLKGKDVSVIEGMGTAPAKATREFFVNRARQTGADTAATAPDSSATRRADAMRVADTKPSVALSKYAGTFAEPLVAKQTGGSGGGGAALTRLGRDVVLRYRRVERRAAAGRAVAC